jgi:hypothetical protein
MFGTMGKGGSSIRGRLGQARCEGSEGELGIVSSLPPSSVTVKRRRSGAGNRGQRKRGTIYGIYESPSSWASRPWYWWADVPPGTVAGHVRPGVTDPASGRALSGIFLNDESRTWAVDANKLRWNSTRRCMRGCSSCCFGYGATTLSGNVGQGLHRGRSRNPHTGRRIRIVMGTRISNHDACPAGWTNAKRESATAVEFETMGGTRKFWGEGSHATRI